MTWLLTLGACALEASSVLQIEQVDTVRLPAWQVEGSSVDHDCGGLLKFCVREVCLVRNADPAPTVGTLVLTVSQRQDQFTRRERVELAAGQQAKIAVPFPEAKALGGEARGTCEVEHTGTRVVCTVANTGALPHEVDVLARLGAQEQRQRVSVAPGQRVPARFSFDQAKGEGSCEIVR